MRTDADLTRQKQTGHMIVLVTSIPDGQLPIGSPGRIEAEKAYREGYRQGAHEAIVECLDCVWWLDIEPLVNERDAAKHAVRESKQPTVEQLAAQARSRGRHQGAAVVLFDVDRLERLGWRHDEIPAIGEAFNQWMRAIEEWQAESIGADKSHFDCPPDIRLDPWGELNRECPYAVLRHQEKRLAWLEGNWFPEDSQKHKQEIERVRENIRILEARIEREENESFTDFGDSAKIGKSEQSAASEPVQTLKLWNAFDLIQSHPKKREPIIDGLLRRGEVCNVIAPPKTGKSWLVINAVLQIATGGNWLGHQCKQGRVLVLDNELHKEELADRYRLVAERMDVSDKFLKESVTLFPMRGIGFDIQDVKSLCEKHSEALQGHDVIVLDALYRFLPAKVSENDNAGMMGVYNTLDSIAKTLDAALIVIHHTSKGDQSQKGLTDIGAGAGSVSRAADTHLTIRQHELADSYVVEAVTRSWRQPEAKTCVFNFPIWRATAIEPKLKQVGQRREEKQTKDDIEADSNLAAVFAGSDNWLSSSQLERLTGMGPTRVNRAIGRASLDGLVKSRHVKRNGRRVEVFRSTATASATR